MKNGRLYKLRFSFRLSIIAILLTSGMIGQSVSPELLNGLKWRMIGPFRGGRAVAVAGVPGDSTTFYFGAVNGGIWKTTDAGTVWTPVFDSQPIGSIGAIAVASSDHKRSTPEPASPIFAPTCPLEMASTNQLTAVQPGPTSALRTRARSAAS